MRQQADLVAHERALAGVLVGAGAAALDHEVRHDAMERQPVVVALARQRRDAQRRDRCVVRQQPQLEDAAARPS